MCCCLRWELRALLAGEEFFIIFFMIKITTCPHFLRILCPTHIINININNKYNLIIYRKFEKIAKLQLLADPWSSLPHQFYYCKIEKLKILSVLFYIVIFRMYDGISTYKFDLPFRHDSIKHMILINWYYWLLRIRQINSNSAMNWEFDIRLCMWMDIVLASVQRQLFHPYISINFFGYSK